eukprot:2189388-Alexandrium_andersonii.AAC.1
MPPQGPNPRGGDCGVLLLMLLLWGGGGLGYACVRTRPMPCVASRCHSCRRRRRPVDAVVVAVVGNAILVAYVAAIGIVVRAIDGRVAVSGVGVGGVGCSGIVSSVWVTVGVALAVAVA